jgi:hypothetical protein
LAIATSHEDDGQPGFSPGIRGRAIAALSYQAAFCENIGNSMLT